MVEPTGDSRGAVTGRNLPSAPTASAVRPLLYDSKKRPRMIVTSVDRNADTDRLKRNIPARSNTDKRTAESKCVVVSPFLGGDLVWTASRSSKITQRNGRDILGIRHYYFPMDTCEQRKLTKYSFGLDPNHLNAYHSKFLIAQIPSTRAFYFPLQGGHSLCDIFCPNGHLKPYP